MPPKSKVYALPEAVRAWLDEALASNGGQQFAALEKKLAAKGFKISDSALQRYHATDLQPRLQALKLATESARTVAAAMGDNDGTMLEALTGLCQERLFNLLIEVDPDNVDGAILAKLARAISDLARASINVKKFVADARVKALQDAADQAQKTARSAGATDDMIERIRADILGIGVPK
ncbi:MAG: DUF3486 family protein [Geobacter sp.]|nr:DUF3486 family protein [Geobacter sp.]